MRGRRHQPKAPTPYPRTARVNEVLREVVADALERAADIDERLRMATVTSIDTAPDLRHATVYMSSLTEDAAIALEGMRVQLQRSISRQVRLKRTPHLAFASDPAVAAGLRVEEILRHLHESEDAEGSDESDESVGSYESEEREPPSGHAAP